MVVLIFVKGESDTLVSLAKKTEEAMAKAGKHPRPLGAYFIFTSNTPGLDNRLRALADKEKLKRINLCIGTAPLRYEVNGEADITVMIYTPGQRNEQHVAANFAFRPGELHPDKVDVIAQALANVLPK